MTTVAEFVPEERCLVAKWGDGTTTEYPWLWLRDHAHDEATVHPVTQQRQLYTAEVDPAIRAASIALDPDDLVVAWADGTTSSVPVAFLARLRAAAGAEAVSAAASRSVEPVLWHGRDLDGTAPSVPYEAVMDSDEGVVEWLRQLARYGFCLALGTPPTLEATERLIERVGYIRHTIFGGFWDFEADLSKADTAYTNLELRPHTDGTYSHDAPGAQLLHCIHFDGTGGESSIVDGLRIARDLREQAPEHFRTLSTVAVPGQYIGDGSHLMAARPVFRHDHTGTLVQVSFNNSDRAPFLLPADEMTAFYDALRAFEELANDHAGQWRHVLRPGEAMLFDNWRVLHGRAAYTGRRHLCGAYLNHEDIESRLRLASSASTR